MNLRNLTKDQKYLYDVIVDEIKMMYGGCSGDIYAEISCIANMSPLEAVIDYEECKRMLPRCWTKKRRGKYATRMRRHESSPNALFLREWESLDNKTKEERLAKILQGYLDGEALLEEDAPRKEPEILEVKTITVEDGHDGSQELKDFVRKNFLSEKEEEEMAEMITRDATETEKTAEALEESMADKNPIDQQESLDLAAKTAMTQTLKAIAEECEAFRKESLESEEGEGSEEELAFDEDDYVEEDDYEEEIEEDDRLVVRDLSLDELLADYQKCRADLTRA